MSDQEFTDPVDSVAQVRNFLKRREAADLRFVSRRLAPYLKELLARIRRKCHRHTVTYSDYTGYLYFSPFGRKDRYKCFRGQRTGSFEQKLKLYRYLPELGWFMDATGLMRKAGFDLPTLGEPSVFKEQSKAVTGGGL